MAAKAGTTPPRQARAARGQQTGGDGRVIEPTDNDIEEANRVQLISYKSRLMESLDKEDELKTKLKAQTANTTALYKLAEASGFAKVRMKRHLKILRGDATSREIAEDFRAELWERETLGMPVGDRQQSIIGLETPQENRDEAFWRSEGYLAYQRGKPCAAPPECPERMVQSFLTGWHDCETVTTLAMQKVAPDKPVVRVNRVPAKAPGADKSVVKPAAEVAAQAKADFDADNAPALKPGDDSFEATPEELAAQAGRRAANEETI